VPLASFPGAGFYPQILPEEAREQVPTRWQTVAHLRCIRLVSIGAKARRAMMVRMVDVEVVFVGETAHAEPPMMGVDSN
jgi:hypothetical protein